MNDYKLRSESLSEFAPAFIKAQGEFTTVGKNKDGRFKYADLDAIMAMAGPILVKHGFFVSHSTEANLDRTLLHTTVMHTSDQWIKSIAFSSPSSTAISRARFALSNNSLAS